MSFFRSEPMSLCQIVLHIESAFNCLIELAYEGKVQFLNTYDGYPLTTKQFTTEIKRCHELKRIISYLQQQIDECSIKTIIYPDVDEDEIPDSDDLKTMEATIQQIYEELIQVAANIGGLQKQRVDLIEMRQVLQKADLFLDNKLQGQESVMAWSESVLQMLIKNEFYDEISEDIHLSFLTGSIPAERFHAFEIMLWRLTRGYFFLKHKELTVSKDAVNNLFPEKLPKKYVFIIFFMGQKLRNKIAKLCQGFDIKLFECPETRQGRQSKQVELAKELSDINEIVERTQQHRFNLLLTASADLYIWGAKVNKMLLVFGLLNRMSQLKHLHISKYLQAKCWIATRDMDSVRSALLLGARRTAKGSSRSIFVPILNVLSKSNLRDLDKPTYFVVNKFTQGFQNLIDAYGIAQYQELNPAPYTIITFPFLFAIMFGDIGHGLIMFLFGIWMVFKEKSLEERTRFAAEQNEIWNILFAGRYIITLMGAFSTYIGFIYNDCFSKSFNTFGSSWRITLNYTIVQKSHYIQLDPYNPEHYLGTPYPFGMDPIWDASGENAITTFNSLKMKLAIIMGVGQMCFGLILSAFNNIHKKQYVDLILVFLPKLMFLLCLFAYLTFLIFFKWIYFGGHTDTPYNTACAPSLLIIFINMLLLKAAEDPPPGCETWMFESQPYLQMGLLALALVCVPILLAGKPIYFMMQKRKIRKIKNEDLKRTRSRLTHSKIRKSLMYSVEGSLYPVISQISAGPVDKTEIELTELWIHSGIHCIESVLGSVSHTASYLRLWALSLAHDQLSAVLWNMVLKIGLTGKRGYWNSLVLCVVFGFWSILTVAILVVMEGLSAFLHTLRLHWVEFQSKFYDGTGEAFRPFRFAKTLPCRDN